jgi:Protein of unknown function (DUF3489).
LSNIKRKKELLEGKAVAGSKQEVATQLPKKATKTERVIALLKRPSGATLKAIMALTGWQAHSVRGFLSAQLVKRKGLEVESTKRKGQRFYRIVS